MPLKEILWFEYLFRDVECFNPIFAVDLREVAKCRSSMRLKDTACVFIIKIFGVDKERVRIL